MTTIKKSNHGGERASLIPTVLCVESLLTLALSGALVLFWDIHSGLSALIGATSYLLPYTLAYAVFFGVFPGSDRLWAKAFSAKRKPLLAGGFMAAELIKVLLSLAMLAVTAVWYTQAVWTVLLLAFGAAIIVTNLVTLACSARQTGAQ